MNRSLFFDIISVGDIVKKIGKVVEVFIPNENDIDIMYSKKIGFKVNINNEIIEIIKNINEKYANIYKDDFVQIIEEDNNLDVELYEGDNSDR